MSIELPAWEKSIMVSPELERIAQKVFRGERLSREDGISLFASNDLLSIGYMADLVRKRKNGDHVYFINNYHINHTNICENMCEICAFGKETAHEKGAYSLSLEEIRNKALEAKKYHVSEVHIVGGLNPDLPFDYYESAITTVHEVLPEAHIQGYDAVEIEFLSRLSSLSIEEVLLRLKEAGLGSLPGGGAEIFAESVRKKIASKKISAEKWLEVHRTAHNLGMRTNATMLYGHIETNENKVDHILKLRELQDETGGFLTFIPLAFHPQNTKLENVSRTTGYDDLKTLAVGRLLLDNFDHVKAFWIMTGIKVSQIALGFGVDDLDGTVREEKIAHDAGAETAQYQPQAGFIKMIKQAGRIPVERDTTYNILKKYL